MNNTGTKSCNLSSHVISRESLQRAFHLMLNIDLYLTHRLRARHHDILPGARHDGDRDLPGERQLPSEPERGRCVLLRRH